MKEFLDNSALIFGNINELKSTTNEIDKYISLKQTSVLTEEKEDALDRKISQLDEKFEQTCNSIRNSIESAKNELNTIEKKESASKEEIEMRNIHIKKYYKELSEVIYSYRNLKSEYKNKEKDLLKQALQIVSPKSNDRDLDKMLDGEDSEKALTTAFAVGSGSGQQMLKRAKSRRKKIDNIVDSINKLVVLIDEIDKIVNKDTQVVDEIVVNVTASEMNTRQANKELESALKTQRRINLIKRALLTVLGIVIVFFLIYIAATRSGTTTNNLYR